MYVFEGRGQIYTTYRITSENRRDVYYFWPRQESISQVTPLGHHLLCSRPVGHPLPLRKTTSPRDLRPVVVRLYIICWACESPASHGGGEDGLFLQQEGEEEINKTDQNGPPLTISGSEACYLVLIKSSVAREMCYSRAQTRMTGFWSILVFQKGRNFFIYT